MKLTDKTVLITGGSSGIGLELARVLIGRGNKVLICGRSHERLEKAKKELHAVEIFPCNLANRAERQALFQWVQTYHPECSVLFNNAAVVHKTNFRTDDDMIEKASLEIQTNLMAPIELSKLFLPMLQLNQGAIVNITTGLIYAPRVVYPIYNATKAGLHAFTKVLREQLRGTPAKIIEVMMAVVDTPWHKGEAPKIALPTEEAVGEMLNKLAKGQEEIRIGKVWLLYFLSRLAPAFAFKKINSVR